MPKEFASQETALNMAEKAYKEAAFLAPFGTPIIGLGCTCALATDRIKKGDHKVWHSQSHAWSVTILLTDLKTQ